MKGLEALTRVPSSEGLPTHKTQTQIDAMSPPPQGELFYNTTTHRMQFHDGTLWIVLGAGGTTSSTTYFLTEAGDRLLAKSGDFLIQE